MGGTGRTAVVYAATDAGDVVALAAAGCGASTCAPLWSTSTGAPAVSGPVVSNATLLVGTEAESIAYRLAP